MIYNACYICVVNTVQSTPHVSYHTSYSRHTVKHTYSELTVVRSVPLLLRRAVALRLRLSRRSWERIAWATQSRCLNPSMVPLDTKCGRLIGGLAMCRCWARQKDRLPAERNTRLQAPVISTHRANAVRTSQNLVSHA